MCVYRIPDHNVKLVELPAQQQEAQERVDALYARWEDLETKTVSN